MPHTREIYLYVSRDIFICERCALRPSKTAAVLLALYAVPFYILRVLLNFRSAKQKMADNMQRLGDVSIV